MRQLTPRRPPRSAPRYARAARQPVAAALGCALALQAGRARAQAAETYASGGFNLLQGGELLHAPQFTGVAAGNAAVGFLGLWFDGRYVFPNHLSVEGNLGVG